MRILAEFNFLACRLDVKQFAHWQVGVSRYLACVDEQYFEESLDCLRRECVQLRSKQFCVFALVVMKVVQKRKRFGEQNLVLDANTLDQAGHLLQQERA